MVRPSGDRKVIDDNTGKGGLGVTDNSARERLVTDADRVRFRREITEAVEWLARYGADEAGGVTRLLYDAAWSSAQRALAEKMAADGLRPYFDDVGNLFGRLEGRKPGLPKIVTGSHVDTVVSGGKLDGAYGVLAGMIALKFLREKFGGDASRWRPNALVLGYPLTDYPALLSGMNEADETTKSVWELAGLASFGTSEPDERLLDRWSPALHVSERTPPAFIWHTADDGLVYVSNALNFAAAMSRHKVPFELHVFESGVHGLALADETSAGGSAHINPAVQPWVDLAMRWLKRRFE